MACIRRINSYFCPYHMDMNRSIVREISNASRSGLRLLLLVLLAACTSAGDRFQADVEDIDVGQVEIRRYGRTIFGLDPDRLQEELKRIQPEFPLFLNGDLDDPETLEKMYGFVTDELLIATNRDVQEAFQDLGWLEDELTGLFRQFQIAIESEYGNSSQPRHLLRLGGRRLAPGSTNSCRNGDYPRR